VKKTVGERDLKSGGVIFVDTPKGCVTRGEERYVRRNSRIYKKGKVLMGRELLKGKKNTLRIREILECGGVYFCPSGPVEFGGGGEDLIRKEFSVFCQGKREVWCRGTHAVGKSIVGGRTLTAWYRRGAGGDLDKGKKRKSENKLPEGTGGGGKGAHLNNGERTKNGITTEVKTTSNVPRKKVYLVEQEIMTVEP